MPSPNEKLVHLFAQMRDMLEILGQDRFRANAFGKASRVIKEMTFDLCPLAGDVKALAKLPGIGKGTAGRISAYLTTGKLNDYDALLAQLPPGLIDLLDIQSLGPKTIALLWKQGGVTDLKCLQAKLKGDELAQLPGLGKKKLDNIRKSIAFNQSAGGCVVLGKARPLALWFVAALSKIKGVTQADYAGSLRRGKETIGDIDLIVAAKSQYTAQIAQAFTQLEPVTQILVQGKTKTAVRTSEGLQVDLRIVEPNQYGAALLYFTGSKEHNILLRQRAIAMGMKLNEYALLKGDRVVASETEQAVYKAMDLAWIPPALREDRGEVLQAEKNAIPQLIELSDIKAELHTHTTASDGRWSIAQLAQAAADRGFHTLAITDHSKGQAQANGLSNKRLEQHIQDIRDVAATMKNQITVLAGSEVDILADGTLDYPDSLLSQLDVVVASPHAALSQEPSKATARLRKAIENPYVTLMGHLTGRLLLRRGGLSPDIHALIQAASKRHIAFEINANTWRLDLRDTHARAVIEAGIPLAINTDAHGPDDLDQLIYGILTARRAGATRENVINCKTQKQLAAWLKSTRATF